MAKETTYNEVVAQPYLNCKFSAGFIENHPDDTLYLRLEREGDSELTILLRPDEAVALVYCLGGVLFSNELRRMST